MIGAKDTNSKEIPNIGRYKTHPTPEKHLKYKTIFNCLCNFPYGYVYILIKIIANIPIKRSDNEMENENGREVTPSTKTLRA